MTGKQTLEGSCLCGSVRFKSEAQPLSFQYCTCRSCQKTTGSAHAANIAVPVESLHWECGEDLIRKFVEEEENPGFPTWFCSRCGSFLPHVSRSGVEYVIPAGLLDTAPEISPEQIIYWGEHPGWYKSSDTLPKHITEPE